MNAANRDSSAVLLKLDGTRSLLSMGLLARIVSLICLFVLELIVISTWLDTSALDGKGGLPGAVGDFGPHILQSLVVLATVLLAFGYSKAKDTVLRIDERLADVPSAWSLLAAHCAAMSAFAFLSSLLFATTRLTGTHLVAGNPLVVTWLAAGLVGIATGVSFFIPAKALRELLYSAGSAWIYAVAAAIITPALVVASKRLWKPATALTFELVRLFLGPFVNGVIAVPAARTIGTQKFAVEIAPACSGLEGVGLMLIFSLLWLWFYRSDYKFPQALLFVPIGVAAIFLLNAVRIALLILIGDARQQQSRLAGFIRRRVGLHSTASRSRSRP